jgi:hypothetical protein
LQYPFRNAVDISGEIMLGTLLSIETLFAKPVLPAASVCFDLETIRPELPFVRTD